MLLSAVAVLVMMAMPPKTDRTGFYAPRTIMRVLVIVNFCGHSTPFANLGTVSFPLRLLAPEHEPEEELEFFENRDGDKIYFRYAGGERGVVPVAPYPADSTRDCVSDATVAGRRCLQRK